MKKILLSILMLLTMPLMALASETDGTIVTGGNEGYAWSNQAGWVNFGAANGNVHITNSGMTGYAWIQNYGWMNLAPSNGGVSVSSTGALSGYAWSSGLGWVNFSGVSINTSGEFVGQASGAGIGTLTFDCTNCSVKTDYRPSSVQTATNAGANTSGGSAPAAPAPSQASPTGEPIEPPAGETPPAEVAEGENVADAEEDLLPDELFDIRLVIDRRTITSVTQLVARTTFESFGRVPTPVDLDFSIVDAQGNVVYSKKDNVVIQTEGVLVTRFTDATELLDGDYVLRLHTLYNTDVEDNFEIPFTINKDAGGDFPWIWVLVGVFGAVLATLFRFAIKKRRCSNCQKEHSCDKCVRLGLCKNCSPAQHENHVAL